MKTVIISIILILSFNISYGIEIAPRITDKEIVERLTKLEQGQNSLNKRIEDLEQSLNKRIDDVNKRIDSLEYSLNKRIDDLRNEMQNSFNILEWMLAIFISILIVIIGFILKIDWQLHKKIVKIEENIRNQENEINFVKDVLKKLFPSKEIL